MAIPPEPTEDLNDRRLDAAKPASAPAPSAQQATVSARPEGHVGGHTVQDWEQPVPGPAAPQPSAATPPQAKTDQQDPLIVDPSPPTTPLYLRPLAKAVAPAVARAVDPAAVRGPTPEPVVFDAKVQTLTAQSAALVDAITRGLAESLALQMRPAVASAIAQLIPMLLSLGNTPEPSGPAGQADVASARAAIEGDAVAGDDAGETPTAA